MSYSGNSIPPLPGRSFNITRLPKEIEEKLEKEVADPIFRKALYDLLDALEPTARRWFSNSLREAEEISIRATTHATIDHHFSGKFLTLVSLRLDRVAYLSGFKINPAISDADGALIEDLRTAMAQTKIKEPSQSETEVGLDALIKVFEMLHETDPENIPAAQQLHRLLVLKKQLQQAKVNDENWKAGMRTAAKEQLKNSDVDFSFPEELCPGHIASENPKICARCGIHIDSLRPEEDNQE